MVLMSEFGDKKTILKLELRHISPGPREVLVVVEERPVPAVSVAVDQNHVLIEIGNIHLDLLLSH